MEQNKKNFLQDNLFITWHLTGDPNLQAYWEDYIEKHPDEKDEFENAIHNLSRVQLNKEALTDIEYHQLLNRIHSSVDKANKKKHSHIFLRYAAAVCILAVISFSFYRYYQHNTVKLPFLSESLIVGENLEEKEIYLITDSETTSFSKDVRVHINEKGSAVVEELGEGGKSKVVETGETKMNKLVVPYGKRSQLQLADGTNVWVNSGSVLEFPSTFTGDTRMVNLVGEMFVDVAKDSHKPFIINTQQLQVKVYGTQFNVSAYQDNTPPAIVLVEGSVGVKAASHKDEIQMKPHEMLTFENNIFTKKNVDILQYISWKDGYLVLQKTSMTNVLKQVERYYNLTFDIPQSNELTSLTCTGKIYLSNDLDNVMETISLLSTTKYRRNEKMIYIDINN